MIATHVSRPIRSASASGPIGWANPSLAMVSIASGSATPSMSAYAASFRYGIRIRLETKPGKSFASAGSLPRSRASSTIAVAVSPKSFEQAYGSLRRGGTLVFVALPAENEIHVPIFETVLNGITIVGSIVGSIIVLLIFGAARGRRSRV